MIKIFLNRNLNIYRISNPKNWIINNFKGGGFCMIDTWLFDNNVEYLLIAISDNVKFLMDFKKTQLIS